MEKYKIENHPIYSGRHVFLNNFDEPKLMQFFPCERKRIDNNNISTINFEEIQELQNNDNLERAILVNSFKEVIPILDSYLLKINSLNDGFFEFKSLLNERYQKIITDLVDGSVLDLT